MLRDASVVVTGGAKGIGRFIAHSFAKEGARVAIADMDRERMEGTLSELKERGGRAMAVPTDVRDDTQMADLMDRVARDFGRVQVADEPNQAGDDPVSIGGISRVNSCLCIWQRTNYENSLGACRFGHSPFDLVIEVHI